MADKDFEIGFEVGGADEAAAEIEKVEKATEELNKDSGQSGEGVGFGDFGRGEAEKRRAEREQKEAEEIIRLKKEEVEATQELTDAEKDLSDAKEKRFTIGEEEVEQAREKQRTQGQNNESSTVANIAALTRGAGSAAAIFASMKASLELFDEFNQRAAAAGINLDKLKETNPGAFGWVETLRTITDPLGALKDFVSSFSGIEGLEASAEQAAALEEGIKRVVAEAERYARIDNQSRINGLKNELTAVNAITEALGRKIALERSARDLEEARARAADEEAIRGGANANVVKAQAAVREGQEEIARLNEDIALTNQSVEEARAKSEQASKEVARLIQLGEGDTEQAAAARQAVEEASQELSRLDLSAGNLREINANKIAEIQLGIQGQLDTAARDIEASTAADARALVDEVIGAGSQLSGLQEQAKASIDQILADGQIAASEQAAFQQAFLQLISGFRTSTQDYQEAAKQGNSLITEQAAVLAQVREEQKRLKAQISQLSGR